MLKESVSKLPMLILADVMVFSVILHFLLMSTLSFKFSKAARLFVIPKYASILHMTYATSKATHISFCFL